MTDGADAHRTLPGSPPRVAVRRVGCARSPSDNAASFVSSWWRPHIYSTSLFELNTESGFPLCYPHGLAPRPRSAHGRSARPAVYSTANRERILAAARSVCRARPRRARSTRSPTARGRAGHGFTGASPRRETVSGCFLPIGRYARALCRLSRRAGCVDGVLRIFRALRACRRRPGCRTRTTTSRLPPVDASAARL